MGTNKQTLNLRARAPSGTEKAAEGDTPTADRGETIRFGSNLWPRLSLSSKDSGEGWSCGGDEPLGASGAVPGQTRGPLLELEPLPPAPPGALSCSPLHLGRWPQPRREEPGTPKVVGAWSFLSCAGYAGSGPGGYVSLAVSLLPAKGGLYLGQAPLRHQVLGHLSPLRSQGGIGSSAQQKLCRGAVATLHSEVQGCLMEPASSIDLCTPVQ